jgi:hypothetical protein
MIRDFRTPTHSYTNTLIAPHRGDGLYWEVHARSWTAHNQLIYTFIGRVVIPFKSAYLRKSKPAMRTTAREDVINAFLPIINRSQSDTDIPL